MSLRGPEIGPPCIERESMRAAEVVVVDEFQAMMAADSGFTAEYNTVIGVGFTNIRTYAAAVEFGQCEFLSPLPGRRRDYNLSWLGKYDAGGVNIIQVRRGSRGSGMVLQSRPL